MRRSYASVAKDDTMSSSLPTSLHNGHSTIFEREEELANPVASSSSDGLKTSLSYDNAQDGSTLPINIMPNSILARTRNRQRYYSSSDNLAATLSSSCSPPRTAYNHVNPYSSTMCSYQSGRLAQSPSGNPSHRSQYHHAIPNYNSSRTLAGRQGTATSYDKRVVLYKTEMCRTFEESGLCRYGAKCQFAHDRSELRQVARHPRYKTEICKTYWQLGTCPYGKRCCFIHNEHEVAHLVLPSLSPSLSSVYEALNEGASGRSASHIPRIALKTASMDESWIEAPKEPGQEGGDEEVDMESMLGQLPIDMLRLL